MSSYTVAYGKRDKEVTCSFLKAVAASGCVHLALLCVVALSSRCGREPWLSDHSIQVRWVAPMPKKGAPAKADDPGPASQKPLQAEAPKPEPKKIAKPVIENPEEESEEPPEKAAEKKEPEPEEQKNKKPVKEDEPEEQKEPEEEKAPGEEDGGEEGSSDTFPDAKRDDIDLARNMVSGRGSLQGSVDGSTAWGLAMAGVKGDVRILHYKRLAGMELLRSWDLPVTVPLNQGLHFDVLIKVDEDGKVMGYQVLHESGNPDMDKSVMALLAKIKKLPPLPREVEEGVLELPIRFVPEDEEPY